MKLSHLQTQVVKNQNQELCQPLRWCLQWLVTEEKRPPCHSNYVCQAKRGFYTFSVISALIFLIIICLIKAIIWCAEPEDCLLTGGPVRSTMVPFLTCSEPYICPPGHNLRHGCQTEWVCVCQDVWTCLHDNTGHSFLLELGVNTKVNLKQKPHPWTFNSSLKKIMLRLFLTGNHQENEYSLDTIVKT